MSKPVSVLYPELMHYTNTAGLTGILASGCVWATHAAFLNDAKEMKHFFDARLLEISLPEAMKYIERLSSFSEWGNLIRIEGGIEKIAKLQAEQQVAQIRSVSLTFNQPYIFSMSVAGTAQISSNGLLSQWRGYGGDGGYALVLDTAEMEQLLANEKMAFRYNFAEMGDVYYYDASCSNKPCPTNIAEAEELVRIGIKALLHDQPSEAANGFYNAISSLSCSYKHSGFAEEREVRVVAIPFVPVAPPITWADGALKPQKSIKLAFAAGDEIKLQKPIKTFVRNGTDVPYLELFKNGGPPETQARLPIKKVIIGPHKDATSRAADIKQLLEKHGYNPEVVCSSIPYVTR